MSFIYTNSKRYYSVMDVFFLPFIELTFKLFIISDKNYSRLDSMHSSRLSSRLNIAYNEASENLKGLGLENTLHHYLLRRTCNMRRCIILQQKH